MTIVEGHIESLKKLKRALNQNGIVRFNSVGQIENFKKNYDYERREIPRTIKNELEDEINPLQFELAGHQRNYDDLKEHISNEINNDIKTLEGEFNQVRAKGNNNLIIKIFSWLKIKRLTSKKANLERNFEKLVQSKTRKSEYKVIKIKNSLDGLNNNKDNIISDRCAQAYKDIDFTKKVIDELYPLIAGSIGESAGKPWGRTSHSQVCLLETQDTG